MVSCALAWLLASSAQAQGLSLQFLGVSTVHITDGQTALMTDGFFSRPAWWRLLTRVAPDEARIQQGRKQAGVSRLSAVLVAHAHHDHAMDAGPVALRTGAQVVGTPSVAQIARGAGLAEAQIRTVQGGEVLRWGAVELPRGRQPVVPDSAPGRAGAGARQCQRDAWPVRRPPGRCGAAERGPAGQAA
jgi:L-ascorbate metabolism protein UlaG (beta-lactamase superfamily)